MSKKNKRKFHTHQTYLEPVKNSSSPSPSSSAGETLADVHGTEYKVIKHDLIKVLVINAIFLAGVLALYYTNLQSGYLEKWFSTFLKF